MICKAVVRWSSGTSISLISSDSYPAVTRERRERHPLRARLTDSSSDPLAARPGIVARAHSPHVLNYQLGAEHCQPHKEAATEHHRTDTSSHPLPEEHAAKRRRERQQ